MKERNSSFLRFLDFWVGIPLLWILSFFKKKRSTSPIQKVGIVKLAGIGDVVLLARALEGYRQKHPERTLIFFCGKGNLEIVKLLKVDEAVCLSVHDPLQAVRTLRGYELDLFIDGESWSRISALFTFFSKAKWTRGFSTKGQYRSYCFDEKITHSLASHEVENFGALLDVKPEPFLWKKASLVREKTILFHLMPGGSRAVYKQWPNAYWKNLAKSLLEKGWKIFLSGSKADRETLEALFPEKTIENMAGLYSLKEMLGKILEMQCVVSVDTGILHLAGALNVPTIGLYGPSSFERWGALGKHVYPLRESTQRPWIQLGFEKPPEQAEEMSLILPEKVLAKIEEILL